MTKKKVLCGCHQDDPSVHRLTPHDHEVVGGIRTGDLALAEEGGSGGKIGRPRRAASAVDLVTVFQNFFSVSLAIMKIKFL